MAETYETETAVTDENYKATVVPHLVQEEEELREPDKKYVPDGFDSVADYLEDLRETYRLDLQADDDNRKAALEDKKFVAGDQWDPFVLQARQGLPNLVVNSIPQFTAQLVGDWRTNKAAIKVLPSENGDKAVADVRADLIRAIETKERAQTVYNNAFESMVQCGDGAFRVGVRYCNEDVFDQEIYLGAIDDALSVVWDRLSIDPTGRDALHCFVDDVIPEKEFKKKWPDAKTPSELGDEERRQLSTEGWCDRGTVRVTEHWRIIERHKNLVMFQDGQIFPLDSLKDEVMDEYIAKHGPMVKSRLSPCRYAQMHLVTGFDILAGPYEWKLNRLPIVRMAGRSVSIGEKRVRYGLVRFMKDDARLRNFWLSTIAEQLGYAPKAQWMATESAVEGREDDLRRAHLSRDPLLIFNDEAQFGVNVERMEPPQIQAALLNQLQVHTQNMKDVSGIHDASLGIKSNETSGRAIQARQREGDIASLTYYDTGNDSILEAGDVINQLIGQIYDGTRVVRIIGEDEAAKMVKINDPMDPDSPNLAVGKYDVAITTGASYTTRRVEAAEAMMEAVQVFPEMMSIAGDLVAKAQDWPGAEDLAERLRKTIPPQLLSDKERAEMGPQQPQGVPPEAMAEIQEMATKMQEQLQKLEVENATLKVKHDIEMRKLEIEEFNAETDRIKVIGDFAKADEEFKVREFEGAEERSFREIEQASQMDKDAADRELKKETLKAKSAAKPQPKPSK